MQQSKETSNGIPWLKKKSTSAKLLKESSSQLVNMKPDSVSDTTVYDQEVLPLQPKENGTPIPPTEISPKQWLTMFELLNTTMQQVNA